jgi:RNA polymerase sigma-70 factor (ECF subfamily)
LVIGTTGPRARLADTPHDWATWFDRHGPALVLLARALVPTLADAEDVVQDAFVRFWRSRGLAADPTAHLLGCVNRYGLDKLRELLREEAFCE